MGGGRRSRPQRYEIQGKLGVKEGSPMKRQSSPRHSTDHTKQPSGHAKINAPASRTTHKTPERERNGGARRKSAQKNNDGAKTKRNHRKSRPHRSPGGSTTRRDKGLYMYTDGYLTQASHNSSHNASSDSWRAWGDSGTGEGSSECPAWDDSSGRSDNDVIRFTPTKEQAAQQRQVKATATGTVNGTSDRTH